MEVTREDMYVNSGYLFNSRVPFKEKKLALRILSAGTYQLHTWPRLPTWRPKGRVDWQLIYIAAGEGHFVLDGQEVIVPAGNMVLYQPKQEQRYFFLGKDCSQYWFMHFTGRMVKSILKHYEIPLDGYILHTGISYEYEDLFTKMRDELIECSWGYEEMLTWLFRELLVKMNCRMNEDVMKVSGFIQDEMSLAKKSEASSDAVKQIAVEILKNIDMQPKKGQAAPVATGDQDDATLKKVFAVMQEDDPSVAIKEDELRMEEQPAQA